MWRRIAAIVLTITFASLSHAAEEQWIVVTAPAFRAALKPLIEHRKSQGLRALILQTSDVLDPNGVRDGDAGKLRDHLRKLCREFKGQTYILLVGAIEAGQLQDPETLVVPALRGTISRMRGQPSDNGYGCLSDDMLPTVAVGRLPARTVAEVEGMVKKTLAYECDDRPGEWRRRLTILAGIPAYNPLVDKFIESQALARFDKLDRAWSGQALYQNSQSRFCVPDASLHDCALKLVQGGQAFILYLGHSNAGGLWGAGAHFLDRNDWARLSIQRGSGVFATFGCNGCQLHGKDGEGYGVAAVRNPGGPAAVLGSHGVCFAAMVQLAADGLFRSGFSGKPPERLGALWLGLKAGLAKGKIDPVTFDLLDAVDGDKNIPLAVQRQEHLEMFVLLGDPALKIPQLPGDIILEVDGSVAAGKAITVHGQLPERLAGAAVSIKLERPPSSEPDGLEFVPKKPGAERDRILLANHERANRFTLSSIEVKPRDNRFEAVINVPADLPWPRVLIRAYAATKHCDGLGVLVLPVVER